MPNGTIKENNQNVRIRALEARCCNLDTQVEKLTRVLNKMIDEIFDLRMGAKHAKACMREMSTVLSAEEERIRLDRNETNRPVSERIHSAGDRRPGLLGTVQSVAKRSV